MTKATHAPSSLRRRKKILKAAKGQQSAKSRLFRTAKEAVRKSMIYSYIGRKKKKGNFRSLWITRIAAACKKEGTSYNKFISGLKRSGIELNRKILADIAINDPVGFKVLVGKTSTK